MAALFAGFGRGAAVGLAWGLVARLFMRLISTSPGFSWAGTIGIVGMSAVLWGLIGVVVAARGAGRSRWWRLAPLPGLILFAGAGLPMLPGAVATGLVLFVRDVRWRLGLIGLASGGTYLVVKALEDQTVLGPRTQTLGNVLMVASIVWMGVGLHWWWRRWTPRSEKLPEPATAAAEVTAKASPAAYDLG